MARAARARGPYFVQFLDPVLRALKELGGSARPGEVVKVVAKRKNIPESQRQETLQAVPFGSTIRSLSLASTLCGRATSTPRSAASGL